FQEWRARPRYLLNEPNFDLQWPIEVNYHQALTFLKRRGKDLPDVEEWWLAAKGTVGSTVKSPSVDYNRSGTPAPVGQGAVAARFPRSDSSVHHLAGNVSEWTRAKEGEDHAEAVGGSYRDTSERLFSGESGDPASLSDTRRGRGFRGVIRPEDFFRGLLPEG
ncbi:MAG: SUMF1/EgtB/PvdO family nonheme iron enzyme, partial [Thermoanaerobaculia bacterium]